MFLPLHDTNALRHIGLHYGTLGLIALNAAVFFLFPIGDGDPALLAYALVPGELTGRAAGVGAVAEPLTLLTSAFLHANVWHLAGNMAFLWVFGDNVEDALGHVRFLGFYALCAIAGGLAHVLAEPDSTIPLIGASGAVAGVTAAYLVLHPRVRLWVLFLGKIPLRVSALWALGAWVAMQLYFAFAEGDIVVAWWAHVGGIVAGILLIVAIRRRGVPLFE